MLRHALRSRRRRKTAVAAAFVAVLIATGGLAVSYVVDMVLYRQRLDFSVFDLADNAVLRPFDYATHDGLRLKSWFIPPKDGRPVVVYFPGRDGNLLRKPGHLMRLAEEEGYGLLLTGYRGYGGNPGRPREFDFYLDAISMIEQFTEAGHAPAGYIAYGYSMGTGIAANTAAQLTPLAVVLEAPLSNFIEAVRQQVGRVPAWLVRTRFDNLSRVSEIRAPVLLLAGEADTVTPTTFALALADRNPAFVTVEVVQAANHVNIIRLGGAIVVRDFLRSIEQNWPPLTLPSSLELSTDIPDMIRALTD